MKEQNRKYENHTGASRNKCAAVGEKTEGEYFKKKQPGYFRTLPQQTMV